MNLLYRISTLQLWIIYAMGVARSLCRRLLLDIVIVNFPQLWLCQPFLRNPPLKLPNSIKGKIKAISPFKVIQGHRFW